MIRLFDNVLEIAEANKIHETITSNDFPWFISKEEKVSGLNKFYTKPCFSHHQFTHVLYNEDGIRSDYFPMFEKYIKFICEKYNISGTLYRSKLNCQYQDGRSLHNYNPVHIDCDEPHTSILYYINESDGDTIYFKGEKEIQRVRPQKNCMVIVDGPQDHCSSNPITTELRYVFNTVILNK